MNTEENPADRRSAPDRRRFTYFCATGGAGFRSGKGAGMVVAG